MTAQARKKVLIAPLDWGLGHATRCVEVIEHLLACQLDIHLAGSGESGKFLQQRFPTMVFHELPHYEIQYHKKSMAWSLLLQMRQIQEAADQENLKVASLQKEHQFDLLVSDNRFGVHHPDTFNIFIAHQLNIQAEGIWKLSSPITRSLLKAKLKPFHKIWIPDFPGPNNLSGILSAANDLNKEQVRVGTLSRFQNETAAPRQDKKYASLSLLSGPEPRRTAFENILVRELQNIPGRHLLLRGKPSQVRTYQQGHVQLLHHLSDEAMSQAIAQSKILISRSGYSSIMDYVRLGCQALLVPTPGQTEQAYLAKRMKEKKWFHSVSEKRLDLEKDLKEASHYRPPTFEKSKLLQKEISQVLESSVLSPL